MKKKYFSLVPAKGLTEGFIPKELHEQLFLHQKQEVGWMFSLENYPAIKMRKKQNALPFLDTGYYIDPANLHEFLSEDNGNDFVDIMVPGGILASQIGSGKTVTMIALSNIGTQLLRGEEEVKAPEMVEESKINDLKISKKKKTVNCFNRARHLKKKIFKISAEINDFYFLLTTKNSSFLENGDIP